MSNYAPAAEHAIRVIEGIAAADAPIGVSELSRKLDINKNMIFRILNSLEASGWVYCENAKYSLTLKPFATTSRAVSRLSLSQAATPLVYTLWEKTGESTYLGIRQADKVMYIQHLDSTKDVRVAGRVGGTYGLHCSAPGKILLAYSSSEYRADYMAVPLQKNTKNTLTEPQLLGKELDKICGQGFAVDNEEYGSGILCLAAPVFDYTGSVVAAVGCSVSTVEFDLNSAVAYLKPLVTATAKEISRRLGYTDKFF